MVIDGKTKIPLSLLSITIPVLFWLFTTHSLANAAYKKAAATEKVIEQIKYSLIRIETKEGTLPKENPFKGLGDQGTEE